MTSLENMLEAVSVMMGEPFAAELEARFDAVWDRGFETASEVYGPTI